MHAHELYKSKFEESSIIILIYNATYNVLIM